MLFNNYFRVRPRIHLGHLADRLRTGVLDDQQYDYRSEDAWSGSPGKTSRRWERTRHHRRSPWSATVRTHVPDQEERSVKIHGLCRAQPGRFVGGLLRNRPPEGAVSLGDDKMGVRVRAFRRCTRSGPVVCVLVPRQARLRRWWHDSEPAFWGRSPSGFRTSPVARRDLEIPPSVAC